MLTAWRDINKGWPARGLIEKEIERALLKSIIHWGEKWEEEVIRIIVCLPKAVSFEKWYQRLHTAEETDCTEKFNTTQANTSKQMCNKFKPQRRNHHPELNNIWSQMSNLNKNHKACREIGKCDAYTRKNLVKNNLFWESPLT